MEEIKVGEYVRTIDGYIRKVEQVNRKGSYDGLCHGAYNVDIPYKYSKGISTKKIKSHSPNIIDLVQEGDYVNGIKVTGIMSGYVYLDKIDIETKKVKTLTDYQIKDIVTKEQFNQVKYEV